MWVKINFKVTEIFILFIGSEYILTAYPHIFSWVLEKVINTSIIIYLRLFLTYFQKDFRNLKYIYFKINVKFNIF